MKKLFALILTLILILSLVACSNDSDPSNGESDSSIPPSSSSAVFSGDVTGTIEGQVYNNDFAELTFTAPADWIYPDFTVMDLDISAPYPSFITVQVDVGRTTDNVSAEEHLEMIFDGYSSEIYKEYGYERVGDFGKTTIRGNDYIVMELNSNLAGNTVKQYHLARVKEGHIIFITFMCGDSNDYDTAFSYFS